MGRGLLLKSPKPATTIATGTKKMRRKLRWGSSTERGGTKKQIGIKMRMVVFFENLGMSVCHMNDAHSPIKAMLNKNSSGETYMFCMYSFMQYSPSYELYSLRMTDTVNLPSLVSITQLPSCFLATESRICVPTPRSSSGMRRFLMPSGSGRAGLVSLMMR